MCLLGLKNINYKSMMDDTLFDLVSFARSFVSLFGCFFLSRRESRIC